MATSFLPARAILFKPTVWSRLLFRKLSPSLHFQIVNLGMLSYTLQRSRHCKILVLLSSDLSTPTSLDLGLMLSPAKVLVRVLDSQQGHELLSSPNNDSECRARLCSTRATRCDFHCSIEDAHDKEKLRSPRTLSRPYRF